MNVTAEAKGAKNTRNRTTRNVCITYKFAFYTFAAFCIITDYFHTSDETTGAVVKDIAKMRPEVVPLTNKIIAPTLALYRGDQRCGIKRLF